MSGTLSSTCWWTSSSPATSATFASPGHIGCSGRGGAGRRSIAERLIELYRHTKGLTPRLVSATTPAQTSRTTTTKTSEPDRRKSESPKEGSRHGLSITVDPTRRKDPGPSGPDGYGAPPTRKRKRGDNGAPEPTDDHIADVFAEEHRNDLRYVAAWGKWFEWTGRLLARGRDAARLRPDPQDLQGAGDRARRHGEDGRGRPHARARRPADRRDRRSVGRRPDGCSTRRTASSTCATGPSARATRATT